MALKSKILLLKRKEKRRKSYCEGNAKLLSKTNSDGGNGWIKDTVGAASHFWTDQHHRKRSGVKKANPQKRVPGTESGAAA